MKNFLCILFSLIAVGYSELPQQLDPFLGLLFETEKCENFISDGSFLAVATVDCKPYTCDFPYQLCMRPSDLYKEEKANECRNVPEDCLIAANGGQPVPTQTTEKSTHLPSLGQFPNIPEYISTIKPKSIPARVITTTNIPLTRSNIRINNVDICDQGVPEGRFCGFSQKFAYNRETGNCEQFWFPGCRTGNTNNNLFDTRIDCIKAITHCNHKAHPTPPQTVPLPQQGLFGTRNDGAPERIRGASGQGGSNSGSLGPISQWLSGMGFGHPSGTNPGQSRTSLSGNGETTNIGGTEEQPNFIKLITNTLQGVSQQRGPAGESNSEMGNNIGNILSKIDSGGIQRLVQSIG